MSTFYGISSDTVSTLFSSLGRSTGSQGASTGSVLADYAAIKNGSYLKLTKAYYKKLDSNDGVSKKTDTAKELTNMKGNADDVTKAADVLLKKGNKSLFEEEPEDRSEVLKAVKNLVDAYNTTVDAGKDANETSILAATSSMTGSVQANRGLLGSVGITVGADNKMSVDEEAFKKAQWSTVKSLFNGNGSFVYGLKAKASYLGISATNAASNVKTYNGSGYKADFDYSSVMDDIV